jgi:hypothetical protein
VLCYKFEFTYHMPLKLVSAAVEALAQQNRDVEQNEYELLHLILLHCIPQTGLFEISHKQTHLALIIIIS